MLELGVSHLFGCSTQSTDYQRELKERLHLPYQLLSDEKRDLMRAAGLPGLEWEVCRHVTSESLICETIQEHVR